MPAVYEYGSMIAFCFFHKADYCIDDILVYHVLDVGLCPVEGEKAHALNDCVVIRVPSRAVNYVGDLVEG